MFYFERIVSVTHRRFPCLRSTWTVASIDRRFLKQLPERVLGRFEFPTTTSRPVEMQKNMLATSRILLGPFAAAFETKWDNEEQLEYYLHASNSDGSVLRMGANRLPGPFGSFHSKGDNNELFLSRKVFKAPYTLYREKHGDNLKTAFQFLNDETIKEDHTVKMANVIKVPALTYTVTTLGGFLLGQRLKFSKSPKETRAFVRERKGGLVNAGAKDLKVRVWDKTKGDGGAWQDCFETDLSEGLTPSARNPVSLSLPRGHIDQDKYVLVTSERDADKWVESVRESMGDGLTKQSQVWIGIDTEFRDGSSKTDVLTVSVEGAPVGLFHLAAMKVSTPDRFPKRLKELLEATNIYPCARNVGTDTSRLRQLGVKVRRQVELSQMALERETQPNGTSLATLCSRYLNLSVDKSFQRADFSVVPMPKELQRYAALDALLHRKLGEKLALLLLEKERDGNGSLLIPGRKVDVMIRGVKAAEGEVIFAYCKGEARVLGEEFVVGKGKAIVRLLHVSRGKAKIPSMNRDFRSSCPAEADLSWVWNESPDRQMAVLSSNLIMQVTGTELQHGQGDAAANVSGEDQEHRGGDGPSADHDKGNSDAST